MEWYGIQRHVLRWIAKCLEDRKQQIQLNGHRLEVLYCRVCFGTTFFTIFIDDIDEEVLCEISKFADDTKIASRVNTLNDIRSMQRTLDKLVTQPNRWDMEFNVDKCGVIHIRKNNFIVSVLDD